MEHQNDLKKMEKERDDQITRIFWAGLEIAVLFAVPLAIAILIGIKMGGQAKWITLPIAFVFSWILMIFRFRKLSKKMKKIDREIKNLKEKMEEESRAGFNTKNNN